MKKWPSIFFAIFLAFPSFSQNTFSRIYDLDEGAVRNYINDFDVLEDSLDATYTTLTKYDMQGATEIIRLKNQNSNFNYTLGDEWIYEQEYFFGVLEVGYKSFSIQDTLFDGIRTKYALGVQDTFYVEDSKMYFWDEHYQSYTMYFDFEETASYEIPYYDPFLDSDEVATVIIDSISHRHFGDDSLKVQHVHILNSGTFEEYTDVVYEGVGAGRLGIRFRLGCGLCDDNPYTTQIRCFTHDSMTYHFVPYACDSTWIITSTHDIDIGEVVVYPNPTNGKIHIKGIDSDTEYELYAHGGQLVQKGKTRDTSIYLESRGLFLLKLKVEESWVFIRVVKIE